MPRTPSQHVDPLAGSRQRKAGIVPIHRFAGADAVCLYALGNNDPAIEHGDVLKLGHLLNHHLATASGASSDSVSDLADDSGCHVSPPVARLLRLFRDYILASNTTPQEMEMMISVAIGARVILGDKGGNPERTTP